MSEINSVTYKPPVSVNKEPVRPPEQVEQKKEVERVRKDNRIDRLV
jgi:hypothetical protein